MSSRHTDGRATCGPRGLRVAVVSGFEADSCYAHAINTIKMAQGFARAGHTVALICRRGRHGRRRRRELLAAYAIDERLSVAQLPHGVGEHWEFGPRVLRLLERWRPDLVFARNYIAPTLTSRHGMRTVVESHGYPDNVTAEFATVLRAAGEEPALTTWVTISEYLSRAYVGRGVPAEKVLVLPDAVDVVAFARPTALPASPYRGPGLHVVYAGHLYDWKGIPTVLAAAGRLPGVQFHLVGGVPADVARQRERVAALGLTNVTLHGQQPHRDVPRYLWHADALLLPPSADHPTARWTSPVKLGEYLAASVPVVASDIPALRDWLRDGETATFFAADDATALVAAIERVLRDGELSRRLVAAGRTLAEEWSYTRRAQRIVAHALHARGAWPGLVGAGSRV